MGNSGVMTGPGLTLLARMCGQQAAASAFV
jgi:hypothetical protein